jgi:superfamily II DNA or RNA helicase
VAGLSSVSLLVMDEVHHAQSKKEAAMGWSYIVSFFLGFAPPNN